MTEKEEKLINGSENSFLIEALLPAFVGSLDYYDDLPDSGYYAYVILTPSMDRLVFQLWDMETEARIEIDGRNSFVFNISPHPDSQEEDVEYEGKYDYRPAERYGSVDNELCERYDGLETDTAIKHLLVDLIESGKK